VKYEELLWLKELAKSNPKVKALGEIGLDFYKDYSDGKKQEEEKAYEVEGVMHCFTGSYGVLSTKFLNFPFNTVFKN